MRSTWWMFVAVFALFGLCTSDEESSAQSERAEKVSSENDPPSEQLAAREIPQQREAFDELASRLAAMGEKPRKAGVSRAMSTEDADEHQAAPRPRHTRSFTDEDVEAIKKNTRETLEEAKKRLLAMSGVKKDAMQKTKGEKMGVISYVVLSILSLCAAAGAAFFVWMLIMNK